MINVKNVQSFKSALTDLQSYLTLNKGDEYTVVVPDKLALYMEQYIFDALNLTSSFTLKVVTLSRLIKRDLNIDEGKKISKVESILLVGKILDEHREEFKSFKSGSYSFAYAEEVYDTLMQLKSSNIFPQDICKKYFDSNLNDKMHDLCKVYQYYNDLKADKLDSNDELLLANVTTLNSIKDRTFIFVGFDDFTAVQYILIETLCKGNNLIFYNYKSKQNNKFIYNYQILDELKKIANITMQNYIVENIINHDDGLVKYIEDNFFSVKEKFILQSNEFKAINCGHIEDEIEAVARDIRSKILSGKSYSQFGVAVFGLDGKADIIKKVFEKYEINYYLDCQLPINFSIFYKFLISLLKYKLEYIKLPHLIDLINSPFLDLTQCEKHDLIMAIKESHLKAELKADRDLKELNSAKEKLLTLIDNFDFIDTYHFVNSVKNYKDKIMLVVDALGERMPQNRILIKKSIETIYELFDKILEVYENLDLETFLNIFTSISSITRVNNLPLTLDCVKIVDALNNFETFENLYIVSCDQNNAPNVKADCGIILDDDIERLDIEKKLSPTIAHINRLNRLRLYNLFTNFKDTLTLTYSYAPCLYIRDLIQSIVKNVGGVFMAQEVQADRSTLALSKWDYIEKLASKDKVNIDLYNIKTNKFAKLNSQSTKIYENLNSISPSFLESYFKCPFASLINRTLKIAPQNDGDIKVLDVGNILHGIAFEYYNKKKNILNREQFVVSKINEYLTKENIFLEKLNAQIIKVLTKEALRMLDGLDYIDKNSDFEPKKFEFYFKEKFFNAGKEIDLNGSVDRVDETKNNFRVVDYKSGRSDPSLTELYYGKKLQLFLYAWAAEKKLNKKAVGCFYLPLHNAVQDKEENAYQLNGIFVNDNSIIKALDNRLEVGDKSDIVNLKMKADGTAYNYGKQLSLGEFDALIEYACTVSRRAITEILSGYIEPVAIDPKNTCEFCPYQQICFRKTNNLRSRKSNGKKIADFMGGSDE